MKPILSNALIFAAGAAIGSVVTWKFIEHKYSQRAEAEIAEMQAYYEDKLADLEPEEEDPAVTELEYSDVPERPKMPDKPPLSEYEQLLKDAGYIVTNHTKEDLANMKNPDHIQTIPPDELGALNGYDVEYFTFYSEDGINGVLADDTGMPVEDADDKVGVEYPECFGEWDDEVVCVRNDKRECDYEITLVKESYEDVVNYDPYHTEDE